MRVERALTKGRHGGIHRTVEGDRECVDLEGVGSKEEFGAERKHGKGGKEEG